MLPVDLVVVDVQISRTAINWTSRIGVRSCMQYGYHSERLLPLQVSSSSCWWYLSLFHFCVLSVYISIRSCSVSLFASLSVHAHCHIFILLLVIIICTVFCDCYTLTHYLFTSLCSLYCYSTLYVLGGTIWNSMRILGLELISVSQPLLQLEAIASLLCGQQKNMYRTTNNIDLFSVMASTIGYH